MYAERIRPYFEATIFGFLLGVALESLCGLGPNFFLVLIAISLCDLALRKKLSLLPAVCAGFCIGLAIVLANQEFRTISEDKYVLGANEKYLVEVKSFMRRGEYVYLSGSDLIRKESISATGRSEKDFEKGDTIKILGVAYPIGNKTAKKEVVNIAASKISLIQKKEKNFLEKTQSVFKKSVNNMIRVPESALAMGVVLGDGREIPKEVNDEFKVSGLSHITVASGYNVSLVAGVASAVGRAVSFYGGIASAALGVMLFPFVSGSGASVWRAVIMALVMLFCSAAGRPYATLRALVYAGVLMVFQNPMILIYDIGFELSFLATLGIVIAAEPIKEECHGITDRFGINDSLATTLSAIIFTAPLIAYYFKTFSLVAIPANILVAPLVPIIMFFVFMTGFWGSLSVYLGYPFAFIAEKVIYLLIKIASFCAGLPFSQILLPQIPGLLIIVVYIVLICGFIYVGYRAEQ